MGLLPPLIVLGTNNRHKAQELARAFATLGVELKTLADFPRPLSVREDGETFADNAKRKAVEQARHLGQWVLGEDSGLMVDALNGEPGVISAHYAGEPTNDAANNRLLLERLGEAPLPQRTAQYVCHMALADPDGVVHAESQGTCRGRIVFAPRGSGGFGYDSLFEVIEYHRTFGELSPLVKTVLSHRGRAARAMAHRLRELGASQPVQGNKN